MQKFRVFFLPNAPTLSWNLRHTLIITEKMQKVGKIFHALRAVPTNTFFKFSKIGILSIPTYEHHLLLIVLNKFTVRFGRNELSLGFVGSGTRQRFGTRLVLSHLLILYLGFAFVAVGEEVAGNFRQAANGEGFFWLNDKWQIWVLLFVLGYLVLRFRLVLSDFVAVGKTDVDAFEANDGPLAMHIISGMII